MNLYHREKDFWAWYASVMAVLIRWRPGATWFVVIATAVARVTSWLSMVLPLKVVLLAASDGVPRYFRFFIDPDDKTFWIVTLTLGAIALFIVTLVLDAVSTRIARAASGDILGRANELAVMQDQEDVAQTHYARLCKVAAYGLFGMAALFLLYLVNAPLAGFLLGMMVATYAFAAWALASSDDIRPGRAKVFVTDNLSSFLSIASSIAFLGGFLVIVIPFALGYGGNLLFAIAAVLLSRQMLGTSTDAVQAGVMLQRRRHRINALVFRDQQLEEQEKRQQLAFRTLFDKPARQQLAMRHLAPDGESVEACWEDSALRFLRLLAITSKGANGELVRYQQQVYPPAHRYRLDNEELLFEHVPRARLLAPEVITRFSEGAFECQVCDYGQGVRLGQEWKQWEWRILQHCWAVEAPVPLADSFQASQRSLHGRFNARMLEKLQIGVDSPEEGRLLAALKQQLPAIQRRLKGMPHYVYNPDLIRENVVFADDDGQSVLVMVWGRWSLEPIGVALPAACKDSDLRDAIERLTEEGRVASGSLVPNDFRVASACRKIERLVAREKLKAALAEVEFLLGKLGDSAHDGESMRSTALG
ncbi:MAG: hypothetical protein JJU06_03525 [Ectothiorhodospiraceae bacterium]|nr:hypothetical protein [Ectothiorhodospiraceae bacterium]MCH8504316.1 hypothetical protein [Ectothiorhodospiraceae bacterium]